MADPPVGYGFKAKRAALRTRPRRGESNHKLLFAYVHVDGQLQHRVTAAMPRAGVGPQNEFHSRLLRRRSDKLSPDPPIEAQTPVGHRYGLHHPPCRRADPSPHRVLEDISAAHRGSPPAAVVHPLT